MKYVLIALLAFGTQLARGENKTTGDVPSYDIVCAGTGLEGTYLATVSVFLPKPDKNVDDNLRKAAVHGVLFKGMGASKDCSAQRPICEETDCEQKHQAFFGEFFGNSAAYNRYVSIVEGSLRVTKRGKKEYCISAVVSVNKDSLRKYLEEKGIIEGFKTIF